MVIIYKNTCQVLYHLRGAYSVIMTGGPNKYIYNKQMFELIFESNLQISNVVFAALNPKCTTKAYCVRFNLFPQYCMNKVRHI